MKKDYINMFKDLDKDESALGQLVTLFDDFKFPDLIKQIHTNNDLRKNKIGALIDNLSSRITDFESALIISPMIVDFLKLTITNDSQLVLIAKVIQKYVASLNVGNNQLGSTDMLKLFDLIQAISNPTNNKSIEKLIKEVDISSIDELVTQLKQKRSSKVKN